MACEFCEISKNTFLQKTPLVAASVYFTLNLFGERWIWQL